MPNDIESLAILSSLPQFGPIKIKSLVEHFGSASVALEADFEEFKHLPGFAPRLSSNWNLWKKDESWKKNLEVLDRLNAKIIPYTSPAYPKKLLEIPDHPVLIYIMGELKPQDLRSIAVIGTRQAGIYGLEMAEKFSRDLASMGVTVVSGLARGIDTAAHHGALKNGRTIAVIGSGLASIYPQENQALAYSIAEKGALISEFPMLTPPDKQNFPQRNRIVAAMTMGTLLIEAPERSGAILTMERAKSYGRPCFAIPGRLDSENFKGNHAWIKNGYAKLVIDSKDVLSQFDDLFSFSPSQPKKAVSQVNLTSEEQSLLNILPSEELSIEEIIGITKLSVMKLNVLLMSLVIKKVIKEYPGKVYKKVLAT